MRQPLTPGDEIRVIAPATSWQASRQADYTRAEQLLRRAGFRVSYGANVRKTERFGTAAVKDRLDDLHEAYADDDVKALVALHGGWAANALLPGIDWGLLRTHPKPLIGFSDIAVLVNAIYSKTGIVNYLGPNFSSLGRTVAREYSWDNLYQVLTSTTPVPLHRSRHWQRKAGQALAATRPWKVLQTGEAEAPVIGGNIGTFYLLQGTPCQPSFDAPFILAAEDDDEAGRYTAREFDRRLESLLQLPGTRQNIRGLLIGRFQVSSGVTLPDVAYIAQRMNLPDIPIVCDMDFGHSWPQLTLPIGGRLSITTNNNQPQLKLLEW